MKYPLEAARTVRASAREAAERRLADAREALERAREAAASALDRLREMRSEEKARRARATDPSTAAGLLREQRYRDAMADEERSLLGALAAARRGERSAVHTLEGAREALTGALVEEKVLDRHQERWARKALKKKEKAEEDELEDQNLSRA